VDRAELTLALTSPQIDRTKERSFELRLRPERVGHRSITYAWRIVPDGSCASWAGTPSFTSI
jgi:hypothetical protein